MTRAKGTSQDDFWQTVGASFATAGRAIGRAAVEVGGACARGVKAIDPDVARFVAQMPVVGLTHLTPAMPGDLVLPDDGQRLVVFVHGLGGHRGNFLPMRWYFGCMGRHRCVAVGFEDRTSIPALAEQLTAFVHALVERCDLGEGPAVDLVCHSMGGLVARAALEDPTFRSLVAHIVTLGTPHHGSDLARWAQTHKILDLRPTSALIERLASQLPWDGAVMPPMTCFWSPSDLVIMPPEAACVEGATNVCMEGFTHLSFLIHPRVMQRTLEAVSPAALAEPAQVEIL